MNRLISRFLADRRRFFASRSWWSFLFCLTLENHIIFLTIAAVWLCLGSSANTPPTVLTHAPSIWDYATRIVLIPVGETLVYQLIPIELTRWLKWPTTCQLLAPLLLFATAHFVFGGFSHGILSGILGGYYLAFTYLLYRERSVTWAVSMTLAFHSLHNALTTAEHTLRHG